MLNTDKDFDDKYTKDIAFAAALKNGKTTILETLLFYMEIINRQGEIMTEKIQLRLAWNYRSDLMANSYKEKIITNGLLLCIK